MTGKIPDHRAGITPEKQSRMFQRGHGRLERLHPLFQILQQQDGFHRDANASA